MPDHYAITDEEVETMITFWWRFETDRQRAQLLAVLRSLSALVPRIQGEVDFLLQIYRIRKANALADESKQYGQIPAHYFSGA